jgi:cell volume regulation protein A
LASALPWGYWWGAAAWTLRRVTLATAGLYPVATLAVAALAFGGADALHGSGFLAVYLAGLLGTAGTAQQTVTSFHQGLAWVGQVAMFVALGLLVFPTSTTWPCADRARARARVRLAPGRGGGVDAPLRFTWAERGRRGRRPARRRAHGPRHLPSHRGVSGSTRLFDVVSSPCCCRRSSRARRSSRWPAGRRHHHEPRCRPLAEAGTIRRLGAEVLEYPCRG